MPALIDLTGERFGRLTVIMRSGIKNGSPLWICKCDCESTTEANTRSLRTGNKRSCGCLHSEQLAERNVNSQKHGGYKERLYGVWHSMKQRCYDASRKDFENYGGRGIFVCDEWKNDYSSFRKWALDNGFDENAAYSKCTLDRINSDGPYAPWNCRWVDAKAQANNRRNNK
ncbi:hypothetical protein [Brevibacillus laterosporus]|nr:hypothetical protein [Brevibacillus laterosporus]MBG9799506.1 hypothetical protein [Brevibacillus laterosporus]MED1909776.1 hypothetical protein [Brevibacillus laterosporus]